MAKPVEADRPRSGLSVTTRRGVKGVDARTTPTMLVALGFEGTVTDEDLRILLGEEKGVADAVAEVANRPVDDENGYTRNMREYIELLAGLPEDRIAAALEAVHLRDGAGELITALREADIHVAIITETFDRGVEAVLDHEGITADTIVANRLSVANGALTGEIEGPLIDGSKAESLERVATTELTNLSDTIAIGARRPDLSMMQTAGEGIGLDPAPMVEPHCDTVVYSIDDLHRLFEERNLL